MESVFGILILFLFTMFLLDIVLFFDFISFKRKVKPNTVWVCKNMRDLDPILSGPYSGLLVIESVDEGHNWWRVQYKLGTYGLISARTLYIEGWEPVQDPVRDPEKGE